MIKTKEVIYYKDNKDEYRIQRNFIIERNYKYDVYQRNKFTNKWLLLDSFITQKEAENYLKELENGKRNKQ